MPGDEAVAVGPDDRRHRVELDEHALPAGGRFEVVDHAGAEEPELDERAENETDIAFDKLLGQKITTRLDLPDDKKRYFTGICNRIS